MFSWTISRAGGPGPGGNFYLPSHRVRIMSAANSCVGWYANDWHGTSLRTTPGHHGEQGTQEVGISFSISPQLAKSWKTYVDANFSEEMRRKLWEDLGKEKGEVYGNE